MSLGSAIEFPSGNIRKYSHSTPDFIIRPFLLNSFICFLSITLGDASTGFPFIHRSDANHPTSLFQGSWIKLSGSGIPNISESAGVISNQAANPANPAPVSCMSFIACAGTNLDLKTPNKSTKLIKKYLIFFSLAILKRFFGII